MQSRLALNSLRGRPKMILNFSSSYLHLPCARIKDVCHLTQIFMVLGNELRALHELGKRSMKEILTQAKFERAFFYS